MDLKIIKKVEFTNTAIEYICEEVHIMEREGVITFPDA